MINKNNYRALLMCIFITGLLLNSVGLFFRFAADNAMLQFLMTLSPAHFLFDPMTGDMPNFLNLIAIFFVLLLLIKKSTSFSNSILLVVISGLFVQSILCCLIGLHFILTQGGQYTAYTFYALFITGLQAFLFYKTIVILFPNKTVLKVVKDYGTYQKEVIQEIPKSVRKYHLMVDTAVIAIFLCFTASFYAHNNDKVFDWIPEDWSVIACFLITSFIYYLSMESLFRTTAAKYFSNSMVVNENGDKTTFGAILLRTIVRHIPFNPISFIGHQDWHDSWSKTTVAQKENILE